MTTPMTIPDAHLAATPSPLVSRVYGEPRFHTDGDVAALAFTAAGTIRSVDETGVLCHWTADGQLLDRAFLSDLETLWCFAPGASQLASGNDDLLFWDADGQLLNRLAQPAWVTALAYSADGKFLASGHDDGSVRIWDVATHALRAEIAAHEQALSAVAFAPDGGSIATAAEDCRVRVWDTATRKQTAEYISHTDRIPALAWAADGSLLVSAGWDTSARVWKPGHADPIMLLNSHSDQVLTLAFAPTENLLATADSDHDIHLWSDPTRATVARVLRGHADEVRAIAFDATATRVASAGADRVIHVWDIATGQLLAGPSPGGRHGIALLPAGDRLFLASTGAQTFRLWDAVTGEEVPPTGDGPAHAVAASADGRYLAVGGTGIFTRLYDRTQNGPPATLEATKPPIGSLSFSPDGRTLAQTSPADGLVWLWTTANADPGLILIEAADGCTLESLAFHPDGTRVVVGGIDYLSTGERTGAVCVWDVPSKKKEAVFDVGVYAVAVDQSGRYVAGAGLNDAVYLWDLQAQEQVFELAGHQEKIHAVAFNPDGSYLVSGGEDCTIRVWDVLSGRLLVVREFDSAVQSLAFSPDGHYLFTGNGNTTCYRIEFRKLLEE